MGIPKRASPETASRGGGREAGERAFGMDDRQRELFLSVVEAGSISKAAQEGYVTPQSVSQHIKRLEAELGVRLLDRTAQGVVPTEAGKVFYEGCRRIRDEADQLVDECRRLGSSLNEKIRLATSSGYSLSLFPRFVPEYLRRNPAIDLEYVSVGDSPLAELKAGAFDVLEGVRVPGDPDVAFAPLCASHRCALVSAKSPLARVPAVKPRDLLDRKVYVFNLRWAKSLDDYLKCVCPGITLLEAPASDYGTVLRLCNSGDAVYLSPDHIAAKFEPLVPIALDVDVVTEYGLVYLSNNEGLLRGFVDCAREVFGVA